MIALISYVGMWHWLGNLRLQRPWPVLMLALALAAIVALSIFLYRKESRLGFWARVGLGALRGCILALLVGILLQPVFAAEEPIRIRPKLLVLVDRSASMGLRDARKDARDLQEAALALGKVPYANVDAMVFPDKLKAELAMASRYDLVRALLVHPEAKVFEQLAKDCDVRYFTFGDRVEAIGQNPPEAAGNLGRAEPDETATRLGDAIEEVVDRHGGADIAGVIVLTDGVSNSGADPLRVVEGMKHRGIPVYTVGVGLPAPDDVQLGGLILQEAVFCEDLVPVRFQIRSHGYQKQMADISLSVDGKVVARKSVTLVDGIQFEEMFFEANRKAGAAKVEVEIAPLAGDGPGNNRLEQTVRVLDDKIHVLYVEGSPRWEYRYLRAVLGRDRRIDAKFIMTEGDSDLSRASKEYVAAFPQDPAEAFKYDLIILGDVPASYFNNEQLARMEELVGDNGGSLLMLSGRKGAPASYAGTPIASVLPVRIGAGKWEEVDKNVHPVVTSAGRQSMVMSLETSEGKNDDVWANVKPLFRLPQMVSAKPGAEVLADLSDSAGRNEAYPLIAWQRYGKGKSLFIASDRLWRLRLKTGDEYHVRFWVQTIQFLTLSRLLGESQRVNLDTDIKKAQVGQTIHLYARVLDESCAPARAGSYPVVIERVGDQGAPGATVELSPVLDSPGIYQGYIVPSAAGRYRLKAPENDQKYANSPEFEVGAPALEDIEPAMQEGLLKQMSQASGGKYFTARDLPELSKLIKAQPQSVAISKEQALWDAWPVMVLLLVMMGCEWAMRRRNDLA